MSDEHPTVPSWTPEPPPARRRRLGPGIVAGAIAVVMLFGGVGLVAARQSASTAQGASSAEAAAAGLLTALGEQDLDKAGRYLDAEERLLLATYRDRVTALLAGRMTGPTGQPLSGLQLTARDVRFQRVAGLGGVDVAVVELAGGTVGGRDARGAKLELPVAELNRRLADQSKGAVKALRVVTVRGDDRWRVSLLASAAEHGRLAAGAAGTGGTAEPDWDPRRAAAGRTRRRLARGGRPRACRRRRRRPPGRPRAALAGRAARPGRLPVGARPPGHHAAGGHRAGRGPPDQDRGGRRRGGQGPGDRRPGHRGCPMSRSLEEATARARRRTWSPSSRTGRGIHPWCSPSPTGCSTEQNGSTRDPDPAGRRRPGLPGPPPPRPGAARADRRGGLVPGGRQRQRRPGAGRVPPSRPGGGRRLGHPVRRLRPDPRPQGQPRDGLPGHPHPRPVPGRVAGPLVRRRRPRQPARRPVRPGPGGQPAPRGGRRGAQGEATLEGATP